MPCGNRHGNRRSHGDKNARNHCRASQERTLPDSPATIEKAFGELLDERFGQARFRHSALRHWLEKCSNRNSRETAAPGNLLPACGLSHSSNSWKIRNRKRKTHQHYHWLSRFWYLSFRVPCCVPSCRGQAWAPFRAGPEYQSHSPLFQEWGRNIQP